MIHLVPTRKVEHHGKIVLCELVHTWARSTPLSERSGNVSEAILLYFRWKNVKRTFLRQIVFHSRDMCYASGSA
jgi:hypothetical protein